MCDKTIYDKIKNGNISVWETPLVKMMVENRLGKYGNVEKENYRFYLW